MAADHTLDQMMNTLGKLKKKKNYETHTQLPIYIILYRYFVHKSIIVYGH